MGKMKSALDRAMERAERLGKASPEELLRMESIPKGNALAARYLRDANCDLDAELTKYKGSGARKYVIEGTEEILLSNIALPMNERSREVTQRAMNGISILKQSKKRVEDIVGQMEHLFSYYEQARQQTYAQLEENFKARMANSMMTSEYQLGGRGKPNVELLPQFQEEWRRVVGQLDAQYEKVLEEQKREISDLP